MARLVALRTAWVDLHGITINVGNVRFHPTQYGPPLPLSEYNFNVDPEAVAMVFPAGFNLYVVSWDLALGSILPTLLLLPPITHSLATREGKVTSWRTPCAKLVRGAWATMTKDPFHRCAASRRNCTAWVVSGR